MRRGMLHCSIGQTLQGSFSAVSQRNALCRSRRELSAQCSKHHRVQGSDVNELGTVDDEDDDGERKHDDTDQSKGSDAGHICAGVGDAVSTQKEAKTAAPGRRQKATSGDKGAQRAKKARVAPKGK